MFVLGIDTSAIVCSVALMEDELVIAKRTVSEGRTHSEVLLPKIKEVLLEANLEPEKIDLIAVSAGPGSFTGLRIGISAVKGIALPLSIPCAGISTLEGLAMNAKHLEGAFVCALMDARRGEFYNALFSVQNGVPHRVTEDRALCGEAIFEQIKNEKNLIILGDGAEKFAQNFPELSQFLAPDEIRFQSGVGVALLGRKAFLEKKSVSANQLSPSYLRLPQAEREWLEKNKK